MAEAGFSDRLREAMLAAAVTPTALAEAVEVRPETVSRWLSGQRHPSRRHLRLIAQTVECVVAELEEGDQEGHAIVRRKPRTALGQRLNRAMALPGYTNARWAEELGVTPGNVSHWRQGRHAPGVARSRRLGSGGGGSCSARR